MATELENPIKIPVSAEKKQAIFDMLEDEDWKWPVAKLNRDKPRYELPAPTKDDKDNVDMTAKWYGVVLIFRKNNYQSKEDREAGKEAKDKRELYVLPVGKFKPIKFYVSPSGVRPWQGAVREAVKTFERPVYGVLVEFSAERVSNAEFKWSKPLFKVSRALSDDELEYVTELRTRVEAAVGTYVDGGELDDIEDEALGIKRGTAEDIEEAHSKVKSAAVDEDEDEPEEKPKGKKKATEPAAEKPKGKAGTKAPPADEDEDEPDEKPKGKAAGKGNYPSVDDDDEELSTTAAGKKKDKPATDPDDEDED